MNSDDLKHHLPTIEDLQKDGLKMLVVIVSRWDGDKVTKYLREHHFHFQFTCMAEGTQGSNILDLLGLGSSDKAMVLCVAPGFRVKPFLPELAEHFHLKKQGRGIAFTIPLEGISIPDFHHNHGKAERVKEILANIESGVTALNNDISHSVILAVVNQGDGEELVETAAAAGAKGGTVVSARRTGVEGVVKFFGINVQMEREIVAILVNREEKQVIMDEINKSFGMDTPSHGLIMSVPVDAVEGIK